MADKSVLGERLRAERTTRGLTIQAAANAAAINHVALSRYEHGQREPSLAVLGRLADYYGVTVDWLIGRTDLRPCTASRPTTFGTRLQVLRLSAQMTQGELATELGLSPSTIGMYEQDRREPTVDSLRKLAARFGCSTDHLLGVALSESNGSGMPLSARIALERLSADLSEQSWAMIVQFARWRQAEDSRAAEDQDQPKE